MHDHPTNPVTRLYWHLADRHPEAFTIASLTAAILLGHLLGKLTMGGLL